MEVPEAVTQIPDSLTARRVFGKPYERDGVTIIPAARLRGGGGGGGGEGQRPGSNGTAQETGSGSGLGFAVGAAPVGAYVIANGKVRWRPALDVTSMILRAQTGLIVLLLLLLRRRGVSGKRPR
jgi:uncharacterized spore protein YtfJ